MSPRLFVNSIAAEPTADDAGRIPYVDLAAQYREERSDLLDLVDRVLASGNYVGGDAVGVLEGNIARFLGVRHAVALNSGTDALILGLIALGVGAGDEVITPPNSFVASTAAVVHVGARPVFVDVLPDQNIDSAAIEAAITSRTKAIMPVHLTGRAAAMTEIMAIAQRRGLAVIEDAAQAIGTRYDGRFAGTFGAVGCFSTHPLKNLSACGDGGIAVTDDDGIAQALRLLRNHGLADRNTVARVGTVSRMDTLQAAILDYRLGRLAGITERRRANAAIYAKKLDPAHIFWPPETGREFNTYHTFVIQVDRRDELQAHLAAQGIGTAIHYPVPIHRQPAFAYLGYRQGAFPVTEQQARRILTLPINQNLSATQVSRVAECVNQFCRSDHNRR
jgi:dTDP-4-amino-4,6-dideoxygalactose transaminase